MADDLYQILGVSRRATDDEIRSAFRKLAKANHPDLNPGNTAAAERFKKITAANEILSDPARRRAYDAGEIDAKGDSRRPAWARGAQRGAASNPFDDMAFGNIFSDVFGGAAGPRGGFGGGYAGPGRGADARYSLEIDFLEAINGTKKRVTIPNGGSLDLAVPEGVTDGQVLRLKGKGQPGANNGPAGDALIEIKIRPHADFKRLGDDILVEVPISIDEAVLGGPIEVPTVTGRVQLNIPKGTSSGKTFRLKGKGLRTKGGGHGDELVTVRIVMPKEIDDTLAYFFSEWRQKHGYDPGRKS